MESISLTKGEFEAVMHRLEISEALADCLCDTFDELADQRDYVETCISAMAQRCRDLGYVSFNPNDMIEVEALADAIEGSTLVGAASSADHPRQAKAAAYRVLSSAAEKVGKAIGRDLSIPTG